MENIPRITRAEDGCRILDNIRGYRAVINPPEYGGLPGKF